MTKDLEKLETMREFLGLISLIVIIVSTILIFSFIFVSNRIDTINREKREFIRSA